jgi:hypothetical protein
MEIIKGWPLGPCNGCDAKVTTQNAMGYCDSCLNESKEATLKHWQAVGPELVEAAKALVEYLPTLETHKDSMLESHIRQMEAALRRAEGRE